MKPIDEIPTVQLISDYKRIVALEKDYSLLSNDYVEERCIVNSASNIIQQELANRQNESAQITKSSNLDNYIMLDNEKIFLHKPQKDCDKCRSCVHI